MARRPGDPANRSAPAPARQGAGRPAAAAAPAAAPIRTLRCRTVAEGRFRQINYVRDLPPQAVDEPTSLPGGEKPGPHPLEVLLAALGSCLAIGVHANAVAQGVAITRLELDVEADIDTTPFSDGDASRPGLLGFDAVRVGVHLEGDAPREALRALVSRSALWSPVANTLHNPVHLDVSLIAEGTPRAARLGGSTPT
jgi:uncharacterized OsmC-like protein